MSFSKYYVTFGHVLLIALVNFTVSLLHPTRKGRLKLIVFSITFQKRSPQLNTMLSQFITLTRLSAISICVSSLLLTQACAPIINNLFI